jgi:hypothetical protein
MRWAERTSFAASAATTSSAPAKDKDMLIADKGKDKLVGGKGRDQVRQ